MRWLPAVQISIVLLSISSACTTQLQGPWIVDSAAEERTSPYEEMARGFVTDCLDRAFFLACDGTRFLRLYLHGSVPLLEIRELSIDFKQLPLTKADKANGYVWRASSTFSCIYRYGETSPRDPPPTEFTWDEISWDIWMDCPDDPFGLKSRFPEVRINEFTSPIAPSESEFPDKIYAVHIGKMDNGRFHLLFKDMHDCDWIFPSFPFPVPLTEIKCPQIED